MSGGKPAARDRVLPLSLQQLAVAGPEVVQASKNLVDLPMGTPPDRIALGRALALVVGRHEPLRMRLVYRKPQPDGRKVGRRQKGQRFAPPTADFPIEVLRCDTGGAEEPVDRFLDGELDLVAAGPLRAGLLVPEEHDARLLLVVHHLAWDGLSRIPFQRDLRTAYHAFAAGTEPMLPRLHSSYSDYLIAQWRAGSRLTAAQVSYWDGIFSGWDAGRTPGLTSPASPSARTAAETVRLTGPQPSAGLRPGVQQAARAMRVTAASVWLAAIFIALWSAHDEDSVCVYWVYHGRDRAGLFDLVGYFSRSVPLRVRMDPRQRFDGLCGELFAQMLSAIRHSAAPYSRRRLAEHLLGPRGETGGDGDRPRLARVTVNVNASQPDQAAPAAPAPVLPVPHTPVPTRPPRPAQLWLELFLDTSPPQVYANYDRRVFPDTMTRAYLSSLITVLETVLGSGPQLTLAELRRTLC